MHQNEARFRFSYCFQATLIEQKTEAIDALKGKIEFVKTYHTHETINNTVNKVEDILMGYTNSFADVVDLDEKVVKTDINKAVGDIEKLLNKPGFGK